MRKTRRTTKKSNRSVAKNVEVIASKAAEKTAEFINLPEVKEALKDYGIVNPIKDVAKENVIVLDNSTLSDYLQHHYYDSVAVDTLKTFGEMTFSKYRLVSNVASTQH